MAELFFYGSLLALPLSALIAQRLPVGPTLRMAFAWFAIFAVALLLASQRDRLDGLSTLFSDQRISGSETRIRMAGDGHFWADVQINGVARRMLIDSGATTTALSTSTAAAAKLDIEESPFPIMIETANGRITARTATATRLVVGRVTISRLAVVVSPAFGDQDVLGMNFLSQLGGWRVEGETLILQPKIGRI